MLDKKQVFTFIAYIAITRADAKENKKHCQNIYDIVSWRD